MFIGAPASGFRAPAASWRGSLERGTGSSTHTQMSSPWPGEPQQARDKVQPPGSRTERGVQARIADPPMEGGRPGNGGVRCTAGVLREFWGAHPGGFF